MRLEANEGMNETFNERYTGTKVYSLTQCSLTVNECDWHILAGNDERINSLLMINYSSLLCLKQHV